MERGRYQIGCARRGWKAFVNGGVSVVDVTITVIVLAIIVVTALVVQEIVGQCALRVAPLES